MSCISEKEEKLPSGPLELLPFGSVKPAGWIREQMQKDMEGFVGKLDLLVPELMGDSIYGSARLHGGSKTKDLGNLKEGDAEGDEQYKWWNSETQSNWRDGYVRHAILLDNAEHLTKAELYIQGILATQDEDGYLGIYDEDLRYNFTGENGELWSKATLYRALLAWYEYSGDEGVWDALVAAVDDVMYNYPINDSEPFYAGNDFTGGVSHGLTFTDVLDRMHQLSGERRYLEYAAFLYFDFSEHHSSENDAQLKNILDPDFKLHSHGVHSYEHLRPLIVAEQVRGGSELKKALDVYLQRIAAATTMSGGPIGDEWIHRRAADATHTGYEFCSIHELLHSYAVLLQKRGLAGIADQIEQIYFNAGQGSRHPELSSIAYLKTDNSYEMLGTRNGEVEPDRKQTRYKYSSVHQDVAVCCVPNAGRISPYYLQSAWMKEGENTLVACLLGPNVLETTVNGENLKIEQETVYPKDLDFVFRFKKVGKKALQLKIRKPLWASEVLCSTDYEEKEGFLYFSGNYKAGDEIRLEFKCELRVLKDPKGEHYFSYGPLLYALPLAAEERLGKDYGYGFVDRYYAPTDTHRYEYIEEHHAVYNGGVVRLSLRNKQSGKLQELVLQPLSETLLRQLSF